MRYLLTEDQARAAEAAAVAAGATLSELLDRAGTALAAEVASLAPSGRIVVVAGAGNNGGDGWVAAHRLHEAGRDVLVLTATEPDDVSSPARGAVRGAIEGGVAWLRVETAEEAAEPLAGADLIVDALWGIGLHGVPRSPYADLITAINAAHRPVLAVDVSSGVDSDTGMVLGPAVAADHTLAFSAPKVGSVLEPGRHLAGKVRVADIGLDRALLRFEGALETWDLADYAASLPVPQWDDRKGTRGRLLIVGGAPGLTGAVCLAANAALRAGAGYVSVAVPAPTSMIVETKLTSPVKLALPADAAGALLPAAVEAVIEAASRADAVVLGPGLGRADSTREAVRELISRLEVPLLIDADALFAIGDDLEPVASRIMPTVLTPHSAEAAKLLATTPEAVDADRCGAVRRLSAGSATAVLKGPATLIAEGDRIVVNPTGGPGLATLGTGDVLSGVIGALLARGMRALDAAALGAYLHGMSGDMASDALTAVCCTAEDVVAYLPQAIRPLLRAEGA